MTIQSIKESQVDAKILGMLAVSPRGSAVWVDFQTSEGWPERALFKSVQDKVWLRRTFERRSSLSAIMSDRGGSRSFRPGGPLGNSLYYLDPARKLGYLARVRARMKRGARRDWLKWMLRQCLFFLVLASSFGVTLEITGASEHLPGDHRTAP